MKKIRVMIVEDSGVVRELLRHLVERDPRLEVAAAVESAEEALKLLPGVSPDVISLDIRLPGMDGFEATRRIMSEKPTPIVVVSASVESQDLRIAMNALKAGALSVVEKPVGASHRDYESLAESLCTQLAIMSEVKVVRQTGVRPRRGLRAGLPPSTIRKVSGGLNPLAVLAIGASTGGPQALSQLLGDLPAEFPMPILTVQHMTPAFLEGFASWLQSVAPQAVCLAREGEDPLPGRVYVAPADRHLRLEGGRLRLSAEPPVSSQRPSATVLFESMAQSLGSGALGILLTGMGDDGAQGLLKLRQAGGYTIAEDQSTAVVYGMPAAAVKIGAASESLPLQEIAPRILELLAVKEAA